MAELWVVNASPIILLAKAEVIQFVPRLCERMVIPSGVVDEVNRGAFSDAGRKWLTETGSRYLVEPAPMPATLASRDLGLGEKQVIAWAIANPGFIAVLDDRQARLSARACGIKILGTLRVLLKLKEHGLIPAVTPPLDKIRAAHGYISPALIQQTLLLAGEA